MLATKFIQEVLQFGSKKYGLKKIYSIDIETNIVRQQFLKGERILAIGLSQFDVEGNVLTHVVKLKDDTDDAEAQLLSQLDEFLAKNSPIIVSGFNLTSYDVPLLTQKRSRYRTNTTAFWHIGNLLESTVMVELKHQTRFILGAQLKESFKFRSIEDLVHHSFFKDISFQPSLVTSDNLKQEGYLYKLWKGGDPVLETHLRNTVHNNLLFTKRIIEAATPETFSFDSTPSSVASSSSSSPSSIGPSSPPSSPSSYSYSPRTSSTSSSSFPTKSPISPEKEPKAFSSNDLFGNPAENQFVAKFPSKKSFKKQDSSPKKRSNEEALNQDSLD